MTRMTKKKEVSESKLDKTTKAKPSEIKSKKASTKSDAAPKTKKTDSAKATKQEKSLKKDAPKKVKEVAVKKEEKGMKQKVVKPIANKKTKSSSKNVVHDVEYLPQNTLFPDIEIQSVKTAVKEIKKETPPQKEEKKISSYSFQIKEEPKQSVLKADPSPSPNYVVPDELENAKKTVHFENIIANDFIIEAIKNAGFLEPNDTLQKALSASLRGSDVLLIKPKQVEGFLIGAITAASKILSESLPKGSVNTPSVLFITPSQAKVDEIYKASHSVFQSLGISIFKLDEHENKETELNQPIDVLVSTPKNLNKAIQRKIIKSKNVGLYFAFEAQNFSNEESIQDLELTIAELSQERTQKIISANENSPCVRELSFKFLEDPEYITTKPIQIKERQPKQFAHALQATQKFQVLLGHLKQHKPNCAAIFANTKPVAEWIAYKLHGNGFKVELITSQLSTQKRIALTKSIQSGDVNIIVTTDAMSKSLGIRELGCIYNFDLPDDPKTFINRICRIEGAKNPIAVSFICEDYGFNIKAIENMLGFKIHIATPDKNYFNLKDLSDYPLESSGKVKRIGVVYEDEVVTEEEPKIITKPEAVVQEPVQKITKKYEIETPSQKETNSFTTKLYPRPESESKEELSAKESSRSQATQFNQKSFEQRKTSYQQGNKHQQDGGVNRSSNDKFSRRDDRAKEAIDAARTAAKAAMDKRKERTYQKVSAPPKRPGLFDIMVSLVQDAVQSAAFAAKDSVANNIQENLPTLSKVLDRFKILKKPSKLQNEKNKNE